jgi:hypothetical protein
LRIARIKSVFDRDYFLGETKFERVHVEKDLAVLVQLNNLNWNSHVDHIRCSIYFNEHVKKYLTSNVRNALFNLG